MEDEKFLEKKRLEAEVAKLERDVDAAIVEGLSDKIALRKLGFRSKIFLSAERTVEDLVEDVARGAERVVVLTDFDEHGKEQHKKISRALNEEIDVMHSARKDFGTQLTSTGRRTVEAVLPLFEDKERKFVEAQLSGLYMDL
ncbi:toprim domain-containing protein [Candidatus Nanohalovita haloferacivicina]|uniref:toprim domain-containing protein n=1 Tax=Candidatus Nanohalovita haloferacivicina TaxID=2978046 RepID=UPI00325FBE90|nr:TOPRIM domain protein [Candidatus Nanohalobia archaeon BNXNv]